MPVSVHEVRALRAACMSAEYKNWCERIDNWLLRGAPSFPAEYQIIGSGNDVVKALVQAYQHVGWAVEDIGEGERTRVLRFSVPSEIDQEPWGK
jgi:hypothetical protein